MKKLFIAAVLMAAGLLAGCTGSTDFFESMVPAGARQNYEASGATGLHLYDQNAATPVTVTPVANGVYFEHPLSQGCTMSWNVQDIDPIDYQYWLAQAVTITYDASLFSCNASFRCRYDGAVSPAVQNGSVWEAPVVCELVP